MGIRDIFKKVKARVTGEEKLEESLESEFGADEKTEEEFGEEPLKGEEELAGGEEEPLEESPEKELFGKSHKAKFEPEEEAEEEKPARRESASLDLDTLKIQIENIKAKLELIETHLKNIESKEEFHKFESDRYLQYMSLINEKMDNLEQELKDALKLMKR